VTRPIQFLAANADQFPELELMTLGAMRTISLFPGGKAAEPGSADAPGYEVLQELGRGGMGVVYLARQHGLHRQVALKMILAGDHAGPAERERFQTEAQAVGQLQHPNVVQVYEVGECAGRPYLSMEYCAGGSLAKKLAGTPLPPREAAAYTVTLARAAHAAHEKGIVHRDLKPANVLLGADGTLKITDFGLAKKLDSAGPTTSGALLGTPSYMAPEQAGAKTGPVGPATDVYALGAILYEMLTGRPPFRAENTWETVRQLINDRPVSVRQLQPKVHRDLETICLKCLEKTCSRRYASAAELADDLQRYLDGKPILARPAGRIERGWRWCRRNPALAGMTGTAVLFLLVGLAATSTFAFRAGRSAEQARDALAQVTEANSREREARLQAEENGRRATVQRDLAGVRFRLARQAVDQFYTQVSDTPELKGHDLENLRTKLLESAANFYEKFACEKDDDPEVIAERARAYRRVASIFGETGRRDRAEASFEEALNLQKRLVAQVPAEPKYRYDLVQTYNAIGEYHWNNGHWNGKLCKPAMDAGVAALPIIRELVAAHPTVPDYRFELATTLDMIGTLNTPRESVWNEALEISKRLVEECPHELRYRVLQTIMLNQLGYFYAESGKDPLAEKALEQGLASARQLIQDEPREAEYQFTLCTLLRNLARLYARTGRLERALDARKECVDVARTLADLHPSVVSYQFGLQHALAALASESEHAGKKEAVLAIREETVERLERMLHEHPEDIRIRCAAMGARFALGQALHTSGRAAAAQKHVEQSRFEEEELTLLSPVEPDRLDELDRGFVEVSNFLKDIDSTRSAEMTQKAQSFRCVANTRRKEVSEAEAQIPAAAKKARDLDKPPCHEFGAPAEHLDAGQILQELGCLQLKAGRLVDAESTLRRAVSVRTKEPASTPADMLARANSHLTLALVLLARGQHAAAATEAEDALKQTATDGELQYNAACVLARAAATVRSDYRLNSEQRLAQADTYSRRAIELLSKDAVASFLQHSSNMDLLDRDTDLNALRERPDFKKLRARIQLPGAGITS
jgi:serine/threonine-protein kinase